MRLASAPSGALLLIVLTAYLFMGWLDDQPVAKEPVQKIKTTKEERLRLACGKLGEIDKRGNFRCTDENGKTVYFVYDKGAK